MPFTVIVSVYINIHIYIYKRSTAALDAYSIYTQCVSTPCFASETNEIFRYTTAALGHMVGRTYLDLEKTGSVPA